MKEPKSPSSGPIVGYGTRGRGQDDEEGPSLNSEAGLIRSSLESTRAQILPRGPISDASSL